MGTSRQFHKQIVVAIIAMKAIIVLYLYGNTTIPKPLNNADPTAALVVTTEKLLSDVKAKLDAKQREHLNHLLNDADQAKGDKAKADAYFKLSNFFETTIENQELAAYYYAEKVKLENSQKNLTFAANFLLNGCINDTNIPNRNFRANIAKELFERALKLAPNDDSLKVGLGGALMHGAFSADPMQGPKTVLEVIAKDSTNAYAHKMLGFGNLQNGQMKKAVERFIKSYTYNPADKYMVLDIAIFAKTANMNDIATEWYNKAKNLHQNNKEIWPSFEKQYQSIK